MLRVTNLVSCIERIQIIKSVSLHIQKGEIVTLIGANGAGKSTLLNTITGLVPVLEGDILFEDCKINRYSPIQTVRLGISLVPEGRQLFASMTVSENLLLGSYYYYGRHAGKTVKDQLDYVYEFFPLLKERHHQLAGTLSGGEQQMLAIARSLMSKPKLILLDEPSMGLAPRIVDEIFQRIDDLRRHGLTVMLVEQNAQKALEVANRGYVIETGQVVMEGDCRDLRQNPEIERAYLGTGSQDIWD